MVYYRQSGSTYQIWIANQSNDSKVNVYSGTDEVQSVAVNGLGTYVAASMKNPLSGKFDIYLFKLGHVDKENHNLHT